MRDLPIPHAVDEVEATYSAVTAHMLTAMRETNEKKQHIERRPTDVTDWHRWSGNWPSKPSAALKLSSAASNTHYSHPPHSQPSQPQHAKYNASSKETRPGRPMPLIWYHHGQLPLTPSPPQCKNSGLWHAPPEKERLVLTVFRPTSSPHCPIRFSLLYINVLYCVMSPATYHTTGLYPRRFVSLKGKHSGGILIGGDPSRGVTPSTAYSSVGCIKPCTRY